MIMTYGQSPGPFHQHHSTATPPFLYRATYIYILLDAARRGTPSVTFSLPRELGGNKLFGTNATTQLTSAPTSTDLTLAAHNVLFFSCYM